MLTKISINISSRIGLYCICICSIDPVDVCIMYNLPLNYNLEEDPSFSFCPEHPDQYYFVDDFRESPLCKQSPFSRAIIKGIEKSVYEGDAAVSLSRKITVPFIYYTPTEEAIKEQLLKHGQDSFFLSNISNIPINPNLDSTAINFIGFNRESEINSGLDYIKPNLDLKYSIQNTFTNDQQLFNIKIIGGILFSSAVFVLIFVVLPLHSQTVPNVLN